MINITIDKEVWLVHTIMQVIWCKSNQECVSCKHSCNKVHSPLNKKSSVLSRTRVLIFYTKLEISVNIFVYNISRYF